MGSKHSKTVGNARSVPQDKDRLGELPTELRLMIFEELLVNWPGPVL
jgi:hypothetical protein